MHFYTLWNIVLVCNLRFVHMHILTVREHFSNRDEGTIVVILLTIR